MSKYLVITCLMATVCCQSGFAQGVLRGKGIGALRKAAESGQTSDESTNRRQDVEGRIWEYKVIDPNEKDASKQTVMTGKIRIKQTSIFAVGKAKTVNGDDNADAGGDEKSSSPAVRGQLKGLLSQRINRANEEETGGDRIGDSSRIGSNKYKYQFDQDDEYPLSGMVNVQPDPKSRNGVWSGYYDQFADGRKVKRWRFEMRKIDE